MLLKPEITVFCYVEAFCEQTVKDCSRLLRKWKPLNRHLNFAILGILMGESGNFNNLRQFCLIWGYLLITLTA